MMHLLHGYLVYVHLPIAILFLIAESFALYVIKTCWGDTKHHTTFFQWAIILSGMMVAAIVWPISLVYFFTSDISWN